MFVNGEYVDDELIRIEAASLRQELREQLPDADDLEIAIRARNWASENIIERTLLRTAAQQDPTPVPVADIQNALNEHYARDPHQAKCMLPSDQERLRASIDLELRIERLTARISAKAARPKQREIKDYYDQYKQSFHLPELVHAAHIVKNVNETTSESDALAAITSIKTLLKNGAKFEEVADQFSDCPGRGGDLGLFPRGEMVDEFEEVVMALERGEISDVFRSPFGFHIAKLYERRPARIRSFEEVRGDVEKLLWEARKGELVRSYLADLRSGAEIRKSSPAKSHPST
jgi:hypothetical protein